MTSIFIAVHNIVHYGLFKISEKHSEIQINLLIENKLIICALGNLHYMTSREKFEPEQGFEPRTSGFLVQGSNT